MSHLVIAVIECNHVSPEGDGCNTHRMVWRTATFDGPAKPRVARRVMTEEKSGWQLGVVGTLNGVPFKTLDFCPEHHVKTVQAFEGGRPRYDLDQIPDKKKDT